MAKNHSECDECDKRHERLAAIEAQLKVQSIILLAALGANAINLFNIFTK